MFIVTTIFLVVLVFAVQQSLLQGFAIDLSSSILEDDFHMIQNIKNILSDAVEKDFTCRELTELAGFIKKQSPNTGFSVNIESISQESSFNCRDAGRGEETPNPATIKFTINGKGIETVVSYVCTKGSGCTEI